MKLVATLLFVFVSLFAIANDPYRAYLLSKFSKQMSPHFQEMSSNSYTKTICVIPRFERPTGAVFCRMEDYLTRKTKVWIKVGVK
jgi:hypothetical protein